MARSYISVIVVGKILRNDAASAGPRVITADYRDSRKAIKSEISDADRCDVRP
jgi:hypothetical protein